MKCAQCGINKTEIINICWECFKENKSDSDKINKLTDEGHTNHCARRQVWGDGECECNLHKLIVDPIGWTMD